MQIVIHVSRSKTNSLKCLLHKRSAGMGAASKKVKGYCPKLVLRSTTQFLKLQLIGNPGVVVTKLTSRQFVWSNVGSILTKLTLKRVVR